LQHAYDHVPYYRRIMRTNDVVDGNGNVILNNFKNIPILTKKTIRLEFEQLKSDDLSKRKHYLNHSGGSTGEPVTLIQDRVYSDWNIANKIYYKKFVGHDIGDRELRFWASEADILRGREDLSIKLRNFLYNRYELNAFKMSKKDLLRFVERWNSLQPNWVEGYAISLYEFAQFIRKNQFSIHSPKGILTTAETLTETMKALIEEVFDTKVFNRYGSREVGDVACSCPEDKGLHISCWNNHVEILNKRLQPVHPGELGDIFITNLNNYAMPIIRYKIGDIAAEPDIPTCNCHRGTPLIKGIEGRVVTFFKRKDGGLVSGGFFIHFIGSVFNDGCIKKFQAIQKDYDLIQIKVVVDDQKRFQRIKTPIEQIIRKQMGNDCKLEWILVERIDAQKSGKYLYTICEIEN